MSCNDNDTEQHGDQVFPKRSSSLVKRGCKRDAKTSQEGEVDYQAKPVHLGEVGLFRLQEPPQKTDWRSEPSRQEGVIT